MDKLDILKKMVDKMPEDADAWYLLGLELANSGQRDEACRAFTKALSFNGIPDQKDKIYQELGKLMSEPAQAEENTRAEEVNDEDRDEEEEENEENEDTFLPDTGHFDTEPSSARLKLVRGSGGNTAEAPAMNTNNSPVDFSDVGGLDELKETIRMRIIRPFSDPGLFSRFKKKIGGGLLLYGPPGCGKTFIAKATAGECSAKFIPAHITDILDPYIGVSEQNVKDIFSNARSKKPCILFFDEIDTVGFNRAKMTSEHLRPVIDQLLSEIEGIDSSTDRMLILGATNMPWDVDPAFKRPGRFDKTIFVPPPDAKAREAIFRLKIEGRPYENIDFAALAKCTELFSGADIDNVVETASEHVIAEIIRTGVERPIGMRDMADAVSGTKPSTVEWLRTIKNYVKYANQSAVYDDVEKYLNSVKKYF